MPVPGRPKPSSRMGAAGSDAAQAVIHDGDALSLLESLYDKSLVRSLPQHEGPRFDLYVSVRDFASAKLDELRQADDRRFEALFLAYLGGVQAREGRLEEARATLDQAAAQIDRTGDPLLPTAVALQRVPLLEAEAAATDDASDREALRARIEALLEEARGGRLFSARLPFRRRRLRPVRGGARAPPRPPGG